MTCGPGVAPSGFPAGDDLARRKSLIGRLPGLRLAVPTSDLEFKPGMAIHSLRELPVLWGEP